MGYICIYLTKKLTMKTVLKAVIFDMDGVLVNSEPLWRKAMIEGFAHYGILLSEEDCRKTQGTRFKEVVRYWLGVYKSPHAPEQVEQSVLSLLIAALGREGECMPGIRAILDDCRQRQIPCGLATSSARVLMDAVLDQLKLRPYFKAVVSAELLPFGKPHPQVFLDCAQAMNIAPQEALVIEDSVNGVVAAKAAQMQVIAVPDPDHTEQRQFALADFWLKDFYEAGELLKRLFP